MKKGTVQIKCPNCNYQGEGKANGDAFFLVIVLIFTVLTFPIGLILPIIYGVWANQVKCPKCKYKNVIKE